MGLFDDFDEAFDFVAESSFSLIGILVRCYLFAFGVATVIFVPFFATLYLDNFVKTIVFNNWIFFLLLFALLLFLKLFKYNTAKNFLVRTFFKLFMVTSIVYVFLFVLKFDSVIYSALAAIPHYFGNAENVFVEIAQGSRFNEIMNGHWFFDTLISLIDKIVEFAKWSFGNVLAIDNSCFSVTAESLDILKIIYTIFAYIFVGGFSILGTFIFSALLFAVLAFGAYLPYSVAFGLTNLCNKAINKYRFNKEYQSTFSKINPFKKKKS